MIDAVLTERFTELDLGAVPSPSGAAALVLHSEEAADCLVVFMASRRSDHARKAAIATFVRCTQSVFGYPNDEALFSVPELGYGFFEAQDSDWSHKITEFNRRHFPDTPDSPARHFFMGCHDASGQFLARDLRVEIFDQDFHEVLTQALQRVVPLPPD
jgi:hypothetical protein